MITQRKPTAYHANNVIVAKARMTCWLGHHGQMDRDGRPHAEHSSRVAMRCKSSIHKVIAYLHDLVEDSDITISEIQYTFGDRVALAVCLLTKTEGMPRSSYMEDVCSNYDAIIVKIADITDNLARLEKDKLLKRAIYHEELLMLRRALRKKTYKI